VLFEAFDPPAQPGAIRVIRRQPVELFGQVGERLLDGANMGRVIRQRVSEHFPGFPSDTIRNILQAIFFPQHKKDAMTESCTPEEITALVDQVRGYMQRHRLKIPDMASHAGVSRHSLKGVVADGRRPREEMRAALAAAIDKPPPAKPEPPHADIVRQHWGRESSEAIGKRVDISGARVRAIAKAIGLTGGDQAAAA
jgi:hypothetical protein